MTDDEKYLLYADRLDELVNLAEALAGLPLDEMDDREFRTTLILAKGMAESALGPEWG